MFKYFQDKQDALDFFNWVRLEVAGKALDKWIDEKTEQSKQEGKYINFSRIYNSLPREAIRKFKEKIFVQLEDIDDAFKKICSVYAKSKDSFFSALSQDRYWQYHLKNHITSPFEFSRDEQLSEFFNELPHDREKAIFVCLSNKYQKLIESLPREISYFMLETISKDETLFHQVLSYEDSFPFLEKLKEMFPNFYKSIKLYVNNFSFRHDVIEKIKRMKESIKTIMHEDTKKSSEKDVENLKKADISDKNEQRRNIEKELKKVERERIKKEKDKYSRYLRMASYKYNKDDNETVDDTTHLTNDEMSIIADLEKSLPGIQDIYYNAKNDIHDNISEESVSLANRVVSLLTGENRLLKDSILKLANIAKRLGKDKLYYISSDAVPINEVKQLLRLSEDNLDFYISLGVNKKLKEDFLLCIDQDKAFSGRKKTPSIRFKELLQDHIDDLKSGNIADKYANMSIDDKLKMETIIQEHPKDNETLIREINKFILCDDKSKFVYNDIPTIKHVTVDEPKQPEQTSAAQTDNSSEQPKQYIYISNNPLISRRINLIGIFYNSK